MRKYLFPLLSVLTTMLLINGCDSSCCQNVISDTLIKPIAVITLNGKTLEGSITCDPTQDETITLVSGSQDSDGQVVENIWKVDGLESSNAVACPPAGQQHEICLIAIDNDGLENQTCITLNATTTVSPEPEPQLQPPVAIIQKGENTGDGQYLDCSNMHDQDTIDSDGVPNPYGSDHAIQEVTWVYTYYKADGTIENNSPHTKTQTQYNTDENLPAGTCQKWFHTDNGVATIKFEVTVLDDDNQTTTQTYTYNVAAGTLTTP